MKQILTNKLFDVLHELKRRSITKSTKLVEIQRIFGVVLGLRIALMELNKLDKCNPDAYTGSLGINKLLIDNFGQMTREQILAYAFPEF